MVNSQLWEVESCVKAKFSAWLLKINGLGLNSFKAEQVYFKMVQLAIAIIEFMQPTWSSSMLNRNGAVGPDCLLN